jgi:2-polyprenyl-3-methyl-5-hydroxy-6-metoxy-1,4-benzoquinol methylase
MRYSEKTTQDRNPLKRFVQRRRLADALSTLRHLAPGFSGRLLDYGAGGGELSGMLARRFPASNVVCYEPAPDLFEEAREDLDGLRNVELVSSFEDLKGRRFEYALCLEVFEHLPPRQTEQAIRRLNRLLAPGGTLVIGVPNELFVPALAKGIFRMSRRYGAFDARPSNVLKAALGRPPKARPVQRIARGLPPHGPHRFRPPRAPREVVRGLRAHALLRQPHRRRALAPEFRDLPGVRVKVPLASGLGVRPHRPRVLRGRGELRRTPSGRSSENLASAHSGEQDGSRKTEAMKRGPRYNIPRVP